MVGLFLIGGCVYMGFLQDQDWLGDDTMNPSLRAEGSQD